MLEDRQRASFNNEFGRPNLAGYFRAFEMPAGGVVRGYHKPIMVAGGVGNLRAPLALKHPIPPGALLVQLGGPGMLIGMGGGAASSLEAGANVADLDFDSVQRGNAEIQRRAQEVIDRCCALGPANPILSIHDVGAGGLSNALPELAHGAGRGRRSILARRRDRKPGMTPRGRCNEAQERYVLAIRPTVSPGSARSASGNGARSPSSGPRRPTAGWWSTTRSSATGRSTSTSP
jgi:phosphoribosylformylglycinamidine synthase